MRVHTFNVSYGTVLGEQDLIERLTVFEEANRMEEKENKGLKS